MQNFDEDFKSAARFHGHICPGLAIGYRVARYVKANYPRSEDEELVAIVENSSCSVDAVSEILGCTFGKGNLIFIDNGKQVFTFYSRPVGKALRIAFKDDILAPFSKLRERSIRGDLSQKEEHELQSMKDRIIQEILQASDADILSVREVSLPEPEKARIFPSIMCQECGESFMEIKGRLLKGKIVCKDCFKRLR